jgi:5-hydroxyisourate hydrolase
MPGVSIHVVDVSRGIVASGMRVELHALAGGRRLICEGIVSRAGTLDDRALREKLRAGEYEAVFHVADYYRREGAVLPPVPFLDVMLFRFGIADPEQHYHLPMKLTPWGLSCFRGGA